MSGDPPGGANQDGGSDSHRPDGIDTGGSGASTEAEDGPTSLSSNDGPNEGGAKYESVVVSDPPVERRGSEAAPAGAGSGQPPSQPARRFDADYLEVVTLKDGRKAALRCIRPSDRALFINGFQRLSDESRYRRFFTPKPRLSEAELDYLTTTDGENHFAVGLALCDDHGEPLHDDAGLGVARFIRLHDDFETAESAIAVVDDAQGLGLGRLLFKRLVEAAIERDVHRFRTEVLSSNKAMKALVESVVDDIEDANIRETRDGPVLVTDFELPRPATPSKDREELLLGPLYELLRAAAIGRQVATRAVVQLLQWRRETSEERAQKDAESAVDKPPASDGGTVVE